MKLLYALIIATSYATAKPQVEPKQGLRGDGVEESGRKLDEGEYHTKSGKSDYYKGEYCTKTGKSKSSKGRDEEYYNYEGGGYYIGVDDGANGEYYEGKCYDY